MKIENGDVIVGTSSKILEQRYLLTPYEYFLIGSSIDEKYEEFPDKPIAVIDEMLSVDECNEQRQRQKRYSNLFLVPLNLDKHSEYYGCTIEEPVLSDADLEDDDNYVPRKK